MKRLLSFLVITGIVAFACFKVGVWWLMDQRLAEARTELAEYGVLERGSISSSVDGRVTLRQAYWEDFRLTQPLHMGLMELETGAPVTLVSTLMNPGNLPASWRLTVESASIMLEPTMFRNWVTAAPDNFTRIPLAHLSCAPDPRQQLGSGDLMRMGLSDIRGDMVLEQRPDALRFELNTRETGSLELIWPDARLTMENLADPASIGTEPLELTVRDAGLMRRLSAYCARESGLDVSDWAGRGVAALEEGLQAGAGGQSAIAGTVSSMADRGGELTMMVSPGSEAFGVPVRTASESSTSLSVSYNGSVVPDVYLTEIQRVEPTLPAQALEPVAAPEDPDSEQWYPDSVENANIWLGRQVRVTLSNEKQVEGRLVSIGDREMEIARTVAGGEVAYPILVRAITQFEVWRRGRQK